MSYLILSLPLIPVGLSALNCPIKTHKIILNKSNTSCCPPGGSAGSRPQRDRGEGGPDDDHAGHHADALRPHAGRARSHAQQNQAQSHQTGEETAVAIRPAWRRPAPNARAIDRPQKKRDGTRVEIVSREETRVAQPGISTR